LVAALADLGDGGVAPDHRHDALVLVVERLRALSAQLAQDVGRRPDAGLLGDRAELGKRRAVAARDVGDVADGVHAGEAVAGELGLYVDAAAAPGGQPAGARDRRRRLASAPDDGTGGDRRAVAELDPVRVHGGDARLQADQGAVLGQALVGVRVGLVGER